jgi:hypothetical protein
LSSGWSWSRFQIASVSFWIAIRTRSFLSVI